MFGSSRLKVEVLDTGDTGLSAPKHVLARLATFVENYDLTNTDQCWLVFDVDRIRAEFLSEVCQVARQKQFQVAVSNPCFELWLLLHFGEVNPNHTTCQHLKTHLKEMLSGYDHADLDLSHYTQERIEAAIQRAKLLHQNQKEPWPEFPGTHVYRVVELLLPHYKKPRPQIFNP